MLGASLELGAWDLEVPALALRECFEPPEQILLARHPDHLIAELAVLEKEERGDRADIVLHRETLVLVDVNLRYFH